MSTVNLQTIRDTAAIFKIIESSFFNMPVHMSYQTRTYPIRPIKLTQDGLVIKAMGRQDKNPRILIITKGGNYFRFTFEFKGANEHYEVLYPALLEIGLAKRDSDRISAEGKGYITNIINQTEIAKSLAFDMKRVNQLVDAYSEKVKGKIDFLELYISERLDPKLRLLMDYDKSIFIPDKNQPDKVSGDFIPFKEYFGLLKSNKLMDKYVSETTLQLKYKNIIPFGYLSAYHSSPMDSSSYKLIEAIGNSLKKDIINLNIISESREKALISDISQGGLSFQFPNSKVFSKLFSLGSTIIFDVATQENELQTLRAIIRNIKPSESSFRVGCELFLENSIEEEAAKQVFQKLSENSEGKS